MALQKINGALLAISGKLVDADICCCGGSSSNSSNSSNNGGLECAEPCELQWSFGNWITISVTTPGCIGGNQICFCPPPLEPGTVEGEIIVTTCQPNPLP